MIAAMGANEGAAGWLKDRLSALVGRPPVYPGRWIVVDTETSGLDPARDALLSIGAVAVDDAGIRIGDSFEVVLRNDAAGSAENVVVHGIGHGAQSEGVPTAEALPAFADYVANAPCVGFHTDFDRAVIERAFAEVGASAPAAPWLDLAQVAAALLPEQHHHGGRSLDDWLTWFAIETTSRHSAAGDALATAELLLRLRVLAAAQGSRGFPALARLARQNRWLGGS
ncbi:MAG: 3'-5' exonuclease [Burkholderiales bacterium]|nr:3'-5' exonuclease [Burkholderiales bacterium]